MFPGKVPAADSILIFWGWKSNPFPQLKIQEVHRWTRIQVLQFCWNEKTRFVWKLWGKMTNSNDWNGFKHHFPHMFMLPLVEFLPKWPKSQASGRMRAVFRCFGPEGKGKIIYTLRESNVAMETPHLYDFPVKIDIRDFQLPCLITRW